jgi:hypothetical protein
MSGRVGLDGALIFSPCLPEATVRRASIQIVLLILASLLVPMPGAAQQSSATLVLRVLVHETERPLEGAQVRISAQARGSVSDEAGQVHITGISAGSHLVEIQRLGYGTERIMVDFAPGEVVEGEVELVVQPVALDPVEVSAERRAAQLQANGFFERRKYGAGTFLTRQEIEARSGKSLEPSALLRRIPNIHLEPARNGRGYAVKTTRGRCYSQVYLDGILMSGERTTTFRAGRAGGGQTQTQVSGVNVDQLISLPNIEAVEWYSGPAGLPPQFNRTGGPDGGPSCGTLVIWTRAGA